MKWVISFLVVLAIHIICGKIGTHPAVPFVIGVPVGTFLFYCLWLLEDGGAL